MVPVPARVVHLPADTRVPSLVRAIPARSVLKVGQMPLQRRLPKFGFKNINRVEYKAINVGDLDTLAAAKNLEKIGLEELRAAGFISRKQLVKILATGTITRAIAVEANAFSEAAQKAIEAAGGSIAKV